MVHFGFSYIGLLYIVMLLVPNFIWAKNKPTDYDKYVVNENKILLAFERAGEALTMTFSLIFTDFNLRPFTIWSLWLAASFLLMLLYELYWIRYFRSPKTMADMYSSFAGFPVAGASLPVIAFFFLGIYGVNIFLAISALILSVGHIGIHLQHRNEVVNEKKKRSKAGIAARVLVLIPVTLIFSLILVSIAGRNINWFRSFIDTSKGINETTYVNIGGQEQYLVIRGRDIHNPVILYIHGGPAGPDSPICTTFTDPLIDDYTVVCWDQRGCGRTYFRNAGNDPDNATVTFERAVRDTDELVDYLRERFDTDKVILLCHSYGSMVGTQYVQAHSEKVAAFIGIGQVVNPQVSYDLEYEEALSRARAKGDDTKKLEEAYARYQNAEKFQDIMALSQAASPYLQAKDSANTLGMAFFSPYTGVDDVRWLLNQVDMDKFYDLEKDLLDAIFAFNIYDYDMTYDVPMYFISGDMDYTCNYTLAEKYCEDITAPDKEFVAISGGGHCPHYATPDAWADEVLRLLEKAL